MKKFCSFKVSSLISLCIIVSMGLYAVPTVTVDSIDPITCPVGGGVGTITLSASNGTAPYEFSLDGVNYQSSAVFTSSTPGGFTAYVRDAISEEGQVTDNLPVVNDITGPVIQTPTMVFATLNTACTGSMPDLLTGATATDDCSVVSFTQSPTVGTPVTVPAVVNAQLTATDSEGNVSSENVQVFFPDPSTIVISSFPFTDNFESSCNGWVSNGPTGSWQLGSATGSVIQGAASGSNAWVVNLAGAYVNNERSYLITPRFDFTNLAKPYIRFQMNLNTSDNTDGVVLQYTVDGGTTWANAQTETAWGQGIVSANPGDQPFGWSGNSNGWVNVSNYLPGLAGESSVQLRFAFASGVNSGSFEGVGIDDFEIVNMYNDVKLLNITSFACTNSEVFEVAVRNLGSASQTNVPLHYRWSKGQSWTTVNIPATIAPGASFTHQITDSLDIWPGSQLIVSVGLDQNLANNSLSFDPQCTCDPPSTQWTVLTEPHWGMVGWTLMDGAQGYVLKAKRANGNWQTFIEPNPEKWCYDFVGVMANTTYEWKIASICDDNGEVKSEWSPSNFFTTPATSSGSRLGSDNLFVENLADGKMEIFPNPASHFVSVNGLLLGESTMVSLYDLTGRQFMLDDLELNNEKVFSLETVPPGIYFLEVKTEGQLHTQKIMVSK